MSELEKTIDLLEEMDDEQLQAIQTVARILVFRKAKDNAKNTSAYFGCIARPMDGIEIQRSMRNEWNCGVSCRYKTGAGALNERKNGNETGMERPLFQGA